LVTLCPSVTPVVKGLLRVLGVSAVFT